MFIGQASKFSESETICRISQAESMCSYQPNSYMPEKQNSLYLCVI